MVERVLRNRRSAYNSRERKKVELERLQQRVVELEQTLKSCLELNRDLIRTVEQAGLLSGIALSQYAPPCEVQTNYDADSQDADISAGDSQLQFLSEQDHSIDPMGWLMGLDMKTWSARDLAGAEMVSPIHDVCRPLSTAAGPDYHSSGVSESSGDPTPIDMQEYHFAIDMFGTTTWLSDGRLAD